ncbi:unnamed protein product, partial [Rotaria sp. Silwood1]
AFTTSLSMWHSYYNESEDEDTWIFLIQDASFSLCQVKFL